MTHRSLIIIALVLQVLPAATAVAQQVTEIRHPDGSVTTVETDKGGRHFIDHSDHSVGQSGEGHSHSDVVRDFTLPGDRVIERRN